MGPGSRRLSSFDLAGLVSTADSPRLGTPATMNLRARGAFFTRPFRATPRRPRRCGTKWSGARQLCCARSRGGPLAPAPPGRGGTGQVLHEHHHHHHHEHDGAAGTSSRVWPWPTWAIAGRGLVLSEEFAEADVSLLASVVGGPLRLPQRGPERRGRCRSGCAGWRRAEPAGLVEVARNADRRSGRARVGSADPEGCLPGRSPCKGDLSGHGLPGAPPLWTPPWPLRGGPWTPARWRKMWF